MTIHLFYSIGTGPREATYLLDGAEHRARFVVPMLLRAGWPVSAAEQAELRPYFFATQQLHLPNPRTGVVPTEALLSDLEGEAGPALFERFAESVTREVPAARHLGSGGAPEIWEVVNRVLSIVQPGDQVVIEFTGGIRSITLGFLLATGLLQSLRPDVLVRAVTYCSLDWNDPTSPTEVFDLLPFLRLFDWAWAAASVARLDAGPLLALTDRTLGRARHEAWTGERDSDVRSLKGLHSALKGLSTSLTFAWPLPTARHLDTWARSMKRFGPEPLGDALARSGEPAARYVLQQLGVMLGGLGTPAPSPILDVTEIHRELCLAAALRQAGRLDDAARLVVETCINVELLAGEEADEWLHRAARETAKARLFRRRVHLAEPPMEVARIWRRMATIRNTFSHSGFTRDPLPSTDKASRKIAAAIKELCGLVGLSTEGGLVLPIPAPPPRAPRWEDPSPPVWLVSAFSLNMLEPGDAILQVEELEHSAARALATRARCAIGHETTAALYSKVLGVPLQQQRETVRLEPGVVLLVGQYRGPRLPLGTTQLPEDASLTWYRVTTR